MTRENVDSVWPAADDEEDFDFVARDEEALGPGVRALCASLGVTGAPSRYPAGSLPVYAVGDAVLKLFPPVHVEELPVEAGVLSAVQGRLTVPTPAVHASGTFERWGYVLMDRMPGVPLASVWPDLSPADRDSLAVQLGEAIASLHAVPVPEIEDWWPEDWPEFVEDQVTGCAGRQRALGLDPAWVAQIPSFLAGVPLGEPEPVLLHTEILGEHLLVEDGRLSGLIDFEPAMRGAPEYDFVGPAVFLADGDARFYDRMLRAYGAGPDRELRQRLMAWTLLHYYSNLGAYLERLPPPAEPTFASLADRWFGKL
ncbi:phosphotransferase family protein [Actinoplanes friuliensis]|uniref:Aminoglycoside phosphotransferase n=1 Tax=Actinoplanes friuliensis DSM 7358 TaxID=1246995 RepID=U5W6W7_9ACTN|nr:aminoglycoside 3'-phosphotransferase/choline kinase family protein [Actinoplanes friuliensis]AGZ44747.1 aminoglycoside phosphotransferase [Actinoplanes friuliensis DSM 7358]